VNNIAVADPTVNSNNTAIGFYGSNARVVWESNLTFNGVIGAASLKLEGGSNPAPSAANGNLLGVDPRFVGAPANFDLAANSPARDAGTAKYGLAATDLDGGARAIGAVDMGAYESGDGAANRAPSATNDSGFQTAYGTPATIRASTLIANDSDPDGDALGVVAVSGATGGTVRLNSASDVVFTPAPDFSGAAGFDYKISDGRGGESSARVSLTVAPPPTVNAPPVAVNDAATTREGATVTIYPLGNDRDPDGDPLSLAVLDLAGTIGAVTTGSNGAVVYNPSGRFEHLGSDHDPGGDASRQRPRHRRRRPQGRRRRQSGGRDGAARRFGLRCVHCGGKRRRPRLVPLRHRRRQRIAGQRGGLPVHRSFRGASQRHLRLLDGGACPCRDLRPRHRRGGAWHEIRGGR
jgi:hypothetical protein